MADQPTWEEQKREEDERLGWVWQEVSRSLPEPPVEECFGPDYLAALHEGIKFLSSHLGQTIDELDGVLAKVDDLEGRLERFEGNAEAINARAERDVWIYEAVCDTSLGFGEIRGKLDKLCETKDWPDTIRTDEGIRQAAKRYAKDKGLTPPPSRRK
jgi:hypothetical protein